MESLGAALELLPHGLHDLRLANCKITPRGTHTHTHRVGQSVVHVYCNVCMYVCIHVMFYHMYRFLVYMFMFTCTYTCTYIHVHTYVHAYIHMYIHTWCTYIHGVHDLFSL